MDSEFEVPSFEEKTKEVATQVAEQVVDVSDVSDVEENVYHCFECEKQFKELEYKLLGYNGKLVKLCEVCWWNASPNEYDFDTKQLKKKIKKQYCVFDYSYEDKCGGLCIDDDYDDEIDASRYCKVCNRLDCIHCDTRPKRVVVIKSF